MERLTKGWVQHQRKAARQEAASGGYPCLLCETEVQPTLEAFKVHYTLNHAAVTGDSEIEDAFNKFTLQGNDATKLGSSATRRTRGALNGGAAASRKRSVSGNPEDDFDRLNLAGDEQSSSRRRSKKLCSPPASITQQRGSSPPTPGRSRAEHSDRDSEFIRNNKATSRQLWTADGDRNAPSPRRPRTPKNHRQGLVDSSPGHRWAQQNKNHRPFTHHDSQPDALSDPRIRRNAASDQQLSGHASKKPKKSLPVSSHPRRPQHSPEESKPFRATLSEPQTPRAASKIRNKTRGIVDEEAEQSYNTPQDLATTTHASGEREMSLTAQEDEDVEEVEDAENARRKIVSELKVRHIDSEQLGIEARGIYAAITLLEQRCTHYDNAERDTALSDLQYQALFALHRSLLHEHCDFLLATQHPAADEKLRGSAVQCQMPARIWRHGIHSFLELLRHHLPHSHEHMLAFVLFAYSTMGLLYETIPRFSDTWIECLGDLGRYRMAIEESDISDRDHWATVSRDWYTKASDRSPDTGRLYHHMAILARPNVVQQLYYYSKSLCVPIPFSDTRQSVLTLFGPLLKGNSASGAGGKASQRVEPVDAALVRAHGILFTKEHVDQLEPSIKQFLDSLDSHIGREHGNWLESGYHVGIALSCLLLEFGDPSNGLMQATLESQDFKTAMDAKEKPEHASAEFKMALSLLSRTCEIVIARCGDKNTLPFLHTILVFYWFMGDFEVGRRYLEDSLPWEGTSLVLNYLLRISESPPRLDTAEIPRAGEGERNPIPEDYALRGLLYTANYYPAGWFGDQESIVEAERYFERPSIVERRRERILWLGHAIATKKSSRLLWDNDARQFSTRSSNDDDQVASATSHVDSGQQM